METEVLVSEIKRLLPKRRPIEHHEPFINKKRTYDEAINCIAKGVTGYQCVELFEDFIRETTGAEHVLCTNTGTAALHVALLAAGIKHGDEVIVPTSTFVATANAIAHAGAAPHFVDSGPYLDPEHLGNYLRKVCKTGHSDKSFNKQSMTPITAVIVVHLLGYPADILGILNVAKEFNLIVIEDASQAFGTTINGKHVGTFGWVGVFSFNNNKIITTNGGGAVITNSGNIYYDAKQLASTARKPHQWLVEHESMAWNYRMGNINAALGLAQARDFHATLAKKRCLATRYRTHLDVAFVDPPVQCEANCWLNTILVDNRDEVLEALHREGIKARASFTPLHTLPFYKYSMGPLYTYQYNINDDHMDKAMSFFNRAVCLPSGANL